MNRRMVSMVAALVSMSCGGSSPRSSTRRELPQAPTLFGGGAYKNAEWDLALDVDPALVDMSGHGSSMQLHTGAKLPGETVHVTLSILLAGPSTPEERLEKTRTIVFAANADPATPETAKAEISDIQDGTLLGVPAKFFTKLTKEQATIDYAAKHHSCSLTVHASVTPPARFEEIRKQLESGIHTASGQVWAGRCR